MEYNCALHFRIYTVCEHHYLTIALINLLITRGPHGLGIVHGNRTVGHRFINPVVTLSKKKKKKKSLPLNQNELYSFNKLVNLSYFITSVLPDTEF